MKRLTLATFAVLFAGLTATAALDDAKPRGATIDLRGGESRDVPM